MIKVYNDGRKGFEVIEATSTKSIYSQNSMVNDFKCMMDQNWGGILQNHQGSLDAAANSCLDIIDDLDGTFNGLISNMIRAFLPEETRTIFREAGHLPDMRGQELEELHEAGGFFDLSDTTKDRLYSYLCSL